MELQECDGKNLCKRAFDLLANQADSCELARTKYYYKDGQ